MKQHNVNHFCLKYAEKIFPHILSRVWFVKCAEKPFPHVAKYAEKVFPHVLSIYEPGSYFFLMEILLLSLPLKYGNAFCVIEIVLY